MGDQFTGIDARRQKFIEAQHLFFVATAASDGKVNLSPKGLDALRVLGPNRVIWLNGVGSGNETAAHLLDNPRMTVMFCSFDREPLILRLYGTAREVQPDQEEWPELIAHFGDLPGPRQIFDLDVELVQTSCGYGVPLMSFEGDRDLLHNWCAKKGDEGLVTYQREKNRVSLDGMPTGLRV